MLRRRNQQKHRKPIGIYQQAQCRDEMDGQADMVYIQIFIIETAGHHDPSNQALGGTQQKQDDQRIDHLFPEHFFGNEIDERNEENQGNQPCPFAVKPFPEINEFEIRQSELKVQVFELPNLLVLFKGLQPCRLIQWRDGTQDRLPFCDGKPRARQARDPAQQHLDDDHSDSNQQPYCYSI